jgi:hypothetical protein
MDREYDIFEVSQGGPMWRCRVSGLLEARQMLQRLSRQTAMERFAIHLPTNQVVARVNVRSGEGARPLIFQVAYDSVRAAARTQIFRRHGYEVLTVIGNESAKVILTLRQRCNLFLVGHAAPEETRVEMVNWLKANYPGVPIVALNPPSISRLIGADFNAKLNGPETLLPVFTAALNETGGSLTSAC